MQSDEEGTQRKHHEQLINLFKLNRVKYPDSFIRFDCVQYFYLFDIVIRSLSNQGIKANNMQSDKEDTQSNMNSK